MKPLKIKTITCHDVYNAGATLQAYALMRYLSDLGHDVEIIDYQPEFMTGGLGFFAVNNPRFKKNLAVKALYLLAKSPSRALYLWRKWRFDAFARRHLPLTQKRYTSNAELQADPPIADVYFAGSDQIWNPSLDNGRDPAFYLDFAPMGAIRASYAASFAVDEIPASCQDKIANLLSGLDFISVRESSGAHLAASLDGRDAMQVMDPVFLHDRNFWDQFAADASINIPKGERYVLVYDFDRNPGIEKFAKKLALERQAKVYSLFKNGSDRRLANASPRDFVRLIQQAECVVSNSFHATAFSVLFGREFFVFNRTEGINTRMRDLLSLLRLEQRLLSLNQAEKQTQGLPAATIPPETQAILEARIADSKRFIQRVIEAATSDSSNSSSSHRKGA